jgi:hypothetical protein
MKWIAIVLSLAVALVGVIGLVSPTALLGFARHFQSASGLYAAAALRVLLGGSLFLAASTSRAPRALRLLGIFIFVAGLVTPFIEPERVRDLLDWASRQGPLFLRGWGAFALGLGALLAWALR